MASAGNFCFLFLFLGWLAGAVCIMYSTENLSLDVFLMLLYLLGYFPALIGLRTLYERSELWRAKLCPSFFTEIHRVEGFDLSSSIIGNGPTDPLLRLDRPLIDSFMSLSPRQVQFITSRLPYAAIYQVRIEFTDATMKSTYYSTARRWLLLCQAIESIWTLQKLEICFESSAKRTQAYAIVLLHNVHRISHLHLRYKEETVSFEEGKEIARALAHQQRLVSLEYSLPISTYPDVLPVVTSLQQLQSVTLSVSAGFAVVDANSAKALSFFLATCSHDNVHLSRLKFDKLEAWRTFCHGISQCRAKTLHLANIIFPKEGAASLGAALASSQISDLTITNTLLRGTSTLSSLLSTLADFSSSVPRLTLDLVEPRFIQGDWDMIGSLVGGRANFDETGDTNAGLARSVSKFDLLMEADLCVLIRAVATCCTLVGLKLPCIQCSEALDDSLAHLLRSNKTLLEALTILAARPGNENVSFPKFLEALRLNVTIQWVDVGRHEPDLLFPGMAVPDHFCDSFKQDVATITRLNRHGRAYLHDDPSNSAKGMMLLDAVKDDLYCLYFHLRENPALCCQSNTSTTMLQPSD